MISKRLPSDGVREDRVYLDHEENGIRTIVVAVFPQGQVPEDLSAYEERALALRAANPGKKGYLGEIR